MPKDDLENDDACTAPHQRSDPSASDREPLDRRSDPDGDNAESGGAGEAGREQAATKHRDDHNSGHRPSAIPDRTGYTAAQLWYVPTRLCEVAPFLRGPRLALDQIERETKFAERFGITSVALGVPTGDGQRVQIIANTIVLEVARRRGIAQIPLVLLDQALSASDIPAAALHHATRSPELEIDDLTLLCGWMLIARPSPKTGCPVPSGVSL